MSILIVGSEGSQGKRFQSILNYIGRRFYCVDDKLPQIMTPSDLSGVIIATPTETHPEVIRKYLPFKQPILVEKPVTKNVKELKELIIECMDHNVVLSMMMQYRQLCTSQLSESSNYDYFKHGNDGLIWDCLQIIGLARGNITLREESPIWHCEINGEILDIQRMDMAYVLEIRQWLQKKNMVSMSQILEIHHKVHEYAETH